MNHHILTTGISLLQNFANSQKIEIAEATGGTKAMSAALALTAGRWSCRISYVGGTERTKDGVGIVVGEAVAGRLLKDTLGLVPASETDLPSVPFSST